jgi:hypothetical protein
MTTKAPSSVKEFPADSIERVAYASVESIATQEPNDRNRLGYHVWRWLVNRQGTLEQAVNESGARIFIAAPEAVSRISEVLTKAGIAI